MILWLRVINYSSFYINLLSGTGNITLNSNGYIGGGGTIQLNTVMISTNQPSFGFVNPFIINTNGVFLVKSNSIMYIDNFGSGEIISYGSGIINNGIIVRR